MHLTNSALCNGMELLLNMRIISNCNYHNWYNDDGRYKCDIGIKRGIVCFWWLIWRHREPSQRFRHNPSRVQAMAATLWHHLAWIPHWPILQWSTLHRFLRYLSHSLFECLNSRVCQWECVWNRVCEWLSTTYIPQCHLINRGKIYGAKEMSYRWASNPKA